LSFAPERIDGVMSFPRAEKVNAAQILAELGEDCARFTTGRAPWPPRLVSPPSPLSPASIALSPGVGPAIADRAALTCWADNCGTARRGPQHSTRAPSRAVATIRTPSESLLAPGARILFRCCEDARSYDPACHGGAKPFLNAA